MHGEKIFTCHFCATLQTGDPGWFSAVFSMFSAAVFSWGCSRRDICQKRFIESVLKVKETWWVDPGSEKHDPLETCILFFSCVWLCDCRGEGIDYCQIFLLLNSSSIYMCWAGGGVSNMNQATWGERGPVKNLLSTLPTENCQPGRQGMLSVLKKSNVGLSSSQSQVWFFTTLGTLPLSKLGKLSPPPFSPNSPSLPPSACCLSQLLLSLGPACMLATDNLVKDWTN